MHILLIEYFREIITTIFVIMIFMILICNYLKKESLDKYQIRFKCQVLLKNKIILYLAASFIVYQMIDLIILILSRQATYYSISFSVLEIGLAVLLISEREQKFLITEKEIITLGFFKQVIKSHYWEHIEHYKILKKNQVRFHLHSKTNIKRSIVCQFSKNMKVSEIEGIIRCLMNHTSENCQKIIS